jgi:hypothetical protein
MKSKWMLLLLALTLAAQEKPAAPTAIPPARRTDSYAVYSALMTKPPLSHADNGKTYLIRDQTSPITVQTKEIEACVSVPLAYRAKFQEALADYGTTGSKSYRLERALTIEKPYILADQDEITRFSKSRMQPSVSDDTGRFSGVTDIITFGNVHFSNDRRLALVHMSSWCGSLCALSGWHVLVKQDDGNWKRMDWQSCFVIS